MERSTDIEVSLFEAFLTETDPGMTRLIAELLDITDPAVIEVEEWDGTERRHAA